MSWSRVKTILALIGGAWLLVTLGGWGIDLINNMLMWLESTGIANR